MDNEKDSRLDSQHWVTQAVAGRRAAKELLVRNGEIDDEQPLRAVLYLRRASAKSAAVEQAVVAQQHICELRAVELRATIVQQYVDVGPGLSAERPGLRRMLDDLKASATTSEPIQYVIAYDHARIARDMHVYMNVVWEIEQTGAQLNIARVPLVEYEAVAGRVSEVFSGWPEEARLRPPSGSEGVDDNQDGEESSERREV